MGEGDRRPQVADRLGPLGAPHLQIHVDDVVVGNREPAEPVRDREGAGLAGGLEVPDDADTMGAPVDRIGAGGVDAAQLGATALGVLLALLADDDVIDRLALADRDVTVRAVERARDRDVLRDEERAIRRASTR